MRTFNFCWLPGFQFHISPKHPAHVCQLENLKLSLYYVSNHSSDLGNGDVPIQVKLRYLSLLSALIFITMLVPNLNFLQNANGAYVKAKPISSGASVNVPNLKVEVVFKNSGKLDTPTTSIAFLGANEILILEKNHGTVRRIIDGQLQANPVLQVKVGNQIEWGMLGIAVSKNNTKTYVFLYYTE